MQWQYIRRSTFRLAVHLANKTLYDGNIKRLNALNFISSRLTDNRALGLSAGQCRFKTSRNHASVGNSNCLKVGAKVHVDSDLSMYGFI